jgi:hypothetical protein
MQRRMLTAAGLVHAMAPWGLWAARPAGAAGLTESDAARGVRAALERGAVTAVASLGRVGGFLDNPRVRIALPGALDHAARLLSFTGQQRRVDDLVLAMNRAAELAVPQAQTVLVSAVKSMSVEDARQIVSGGDDSVTRFFAAKTRAPLAEKLLPIVTRATEKVDLADRYNAVAGKAAAGGLLRQDDANLQRYVTGKTLDGVYLVIGEEERAIRRHPAATGSALLKQVFGPAH